MYLVLDRSLEESPERLQLALKYEQLITRQRGYDLHVNLYEDEDNIVHILEWNQRYAGGNYQFACDRHKRLMDGDPVPVCRKLPTCLGCVIKYL